MFNVILKTFVKDYQNTSHYKVREDIGILCSILSIICNFLMVAFKLVVGLLTHSIAIQADAFNNLSDMGSNIATLIGFKLASKHPDSDHPYGHGRYEYIAGLVISFLIILVALTSFKDAVIKIMNPEKLHFHIGAVIVLIVSIMIKVWMSSFNKKAGEMISSTSLKAASADSLNDVFVTLSTLLSLCISLVLDFPIDGFVGAIVSLFVLKAGYEVFRETVSPLLGQAPDKELMDEIFENISKYDKILSIHDFMMHDYGPGRRFCSFHAEVDSRENIMVVHDQIDSLERELLDKFHILTTIHMDPLDMDNETLNKVREKVKYIINDINPHYSIHDFRMVSGPTHTNIIFDVLVPADDTIAHSTLKQMIYKRVRELDSTYYCVVQIDHSYL